MNRVALWVGFIATSGTTCAIAADLNPPGFYVGAAAVQAGDVYTAFGASDHTQTSWKWMAGLRPVPFIGAELEQASLGSAAFSAAQGPRGGPFSGTWHANVTSLFAVGYLPLATPHLDIFAKVGAERTHTRVDGIPLPLCATVAPYCPFALIVDHVNDTETAFAYGAGVQVKLRPFAVRAEYERTRTSLGNPRLLSLGLTYTF
jgi:opacity protein-like surface antigen